MFPQGPEAPAVPVQTTFYNKSYKVYPQPPKVGNGDTLGVVVRKYVYDGEKGYGIKYMLVPDAVVVYAKSKGLKDASRYDIMGRQATFELKTRRGRKVVYVNDASLNYFIRPPASIAMYADMTEEAIADSAARGGYDPAYSMTLKEDDNNKEFFDTCQQIVTDYNQWVWDNADLLPKTKEDILDEVREDLEDADETTIQATARERFATVKTKDQEGYTFCSIKTDETGLRNIKLKAGNDWTPSQPQGLHGGFFGATALIAVIMFARSSRLLTTSCLLARTGLALPWSSRIPLRFMPLARMAVRTPMR